MGRRCSYSAGVAPWAETVQMPDGHRARVGTGPRLFIIMTSKESKPSASALTEMRERQQDHSAFKSGSRPGTDDLLAGAPFMSDDIRIDARSWCEERLTMPRIGRRLIGRHLRAMRDNVSLETIAPVESYLREIGDIDEAARMLVYRACLQDDDARRQLATYILSEETWGTYEDSWRLAVAVGLANVSRKSMPAYRIVGSLHVGARAANLADLRLASEAIAEKKKQDERDEKDATTRDVMTSLHGLQSTDDDTIRAVLEDRAEIEPARPPGLIVVPELPAASSGARRDIYKSWSGLAGEPLALVPRGDIAAQRQQLAERWPHAIDIIDTILGDLAARETIRFRPTLLVGEPGSGKSSLASAICETVGLPTELYSMAGIADGSLGGTSAQWATARESIPLQLIKRSKQASVGVIWDEIEKSADGRHNGNAIETLLPMLEIDQARRFRDLALEVEVDLSAVSHFATANSLDGVPAPIRDRMRVLTMPTPGWTHLGTLTKQIVDRIAKERGVDSRWFAPLAEDEMDLVRSAWPGGSLRQLTRIITTLIDGRDRLIGRC